MFKTIFSFHKNAEEATFFYVLFFTEQGGLVLEMMEMGNLLRVYQKNLSI